MAEARVEEEEESLREAREAGGARRHPRAPTSASDRADRNKPEQRQCSTPGALSSIRAAIKRTSNRAAAPTDQIRVRRRPEITILAAEPLATNSWFPGGSGAFPPAPPPAQPSWSGSVMVQLPPPSYEQVIREKSREQNTQTSSLSSSSSSSSPSSSLSSSSSTSAPRHSVTIATQTEPETSERQSCTKTSMRRPPKPPRPFLPLTPKPAQPVLAHTYSLIELDEPDPSCSTHTLTHPPSGEQRPSGVQTDIPAAPEPVTSVTPDSTQSQVPAKQEVSARPRPRPRSSALPQTVIKEERQVQPITSEVKVQTLVRLKDNGTDSVFAGFTDTSVDVTSNKYLQDLLDVFGCSKPDIQRDQHDESKKSDEEDSYVVSALVPEPLETITRPEPQLRTQNPKPPFSTTPQTVDETKTSSEEQNKPSVPPVPAPRQLVKKTSVSPKHQGTSEEKAELPPLRPPPRPSLAPRTSRVPTQEDGAQSAEVPFNPSGKRSSGDDYSSITAAPGVPEAISISRRGRGTCPVKPPPPTHTPVHTPAQDAVSAESKSGPSLPHHGTEGRLPPLRPPPVKLSKFSQSAGSSLTRVPASQRSGYREVKRGPPLPPRPQPGHPLYRQYTSKIPQGNIKVNPSVSDPEESYLQKDKLLVILEDLAGPRETAHKVKGQREDPVSEEPMFQKRPETIEEPHTEEQEPETNTSIRYRAGFAFDGEDGELTFCIGDVITLIDYVNDEWGRGHLNGRTGSFPLNFVQVVQETPAKKSESPAPAACVGGQTGRALYDFTPESEDELCLKVGDMVCSLEEVDEEWFVGESAGHRGIVPKNYVQLL